MSTLIPEALEAWREAERLLDELPPTSPDHETVARLVSELRETHARLLNASALTARAIATNRVTIDAARALIATVRKRA